MSFYWIKFAKNLEDVIKEKILTLPENYEKLIKNPKKLYFVEHFKQLFDLKNNLYADTKIHYKEKQLYYKLVLQLFGMFPQHDIIDFGLQKFYIFPKEINHRCYEIDIIDFCFKNDTIFVYAYTHGYYILMVHKIKEKRFYCFKITEILKDNEFPYGYSKFFEIVDSFIKNKQVYNDYFIVPFDEIFFSMNDGWINKKRTRFENADLGLRYYMIWNIYPKNQATYQED